MGCLRDRYFQWICQIAMNGEAENHQRLLRFLFNKDYRYIHPRDENRESDGIDLRYRFGYVSDAPLYQITNELDNRPCSVLEMMVALALRCEENIMRDFEIGDRTFEWFKDMLYSLNLYYDDQHFNESRADVVIDLFLDRHYAPDGNGGLFHLRHPYEDLRQVETWCQAMWWIDEKLHIQ